MTQIKALITYLDAMRAGKQVAVVYATRRTLMTDKTIMIRVLISSKHHRPIMTEALLIHVYMRTTAQP
jgi:hypothetical protein